MFAACGALDAENATAAARLARAYRWPTVLRGLTVVRNEGIVGVGGGTVKDSADARVGT